MTRGRENARTRKPWDDAGKPWDDPQTAWDDASSHVGRSANKAAPPRGALPGGAGTPGTPGTIRCTHALRGHGTAGTPDPDYFPFLQDEKEERAAAVAWCGSTCGAGLQRIVPTVPIVPPLDSDGGVLSTARERS